MARSLTFGKNLSEPTPAESSSEPLLIWHPLTPNGVAGAARAPRWQLWVALTLTAALSIATTINFFERAWVPVITKAIESLDDGGAIRNGLLEPGGQRTSVVLAANRNLAIALDWSAAGVHDQASDVRVILQIDRALVCSLFGCAGISYRTLGDMPIGHTETGAWWRAWRPTILSGIAVGQAMFLVISWWVLAIVYAWAIRFFAFYLDRDVDFGGAARVAQAALIPGAIWLTVSMYLHTEGWLNLFGLLVVFIMHVPVGWIYSGAACRYLPPRADVLPANPFQPIEEETHADPKNPFRGAGD
ncbi:hypothetical protein GC207_02925 [bacterium]|nr:hypothetical protein [bacterium]